MSNTNSNEDMESDIRWHLEQLGVSMSRIYSIPEDLRRAGYLEKMEKPEQVEWFLEERNGEIRLDEEVMEEIYE